MLRFIRTFQNCNPECYVFQNLQYWIFHRPGCTYFSTIVETNKLNSDSKNGGNKIKLHKPTPSQVKENQQNVNVEPKVQLKYEMERAGFSQEYNKHTFLSNMINVKEYVRLIDSNSPTDAVQILYSLTRKKFKSPEVFKAISHKICQAPVNTFTLKECSDILYSTAVSSYKDEGFLEKISSCILSQPFDETARKYTPLIMRSLGSLKYKNNELIEALLKNIIEFPIPKSTKDLLTCLMTLAIVNFKTPYLSVLIKELSKLSSDSFFGTREYLEFVWASVLLNELDVNHISNVLSKNYIEALRVFGGVDGKNDTINLKLQNINAAATCLIPSYNGSILSNNFNRPLLSKTKTKFLSFTVDGLCHIFPRNGYLKTCKDIKTGFLIDVEFMVDSEGAPIPLQKTEGVKVAIVLLDFNDYCLGEEKLLTGFNNFKKRILEAKGYKVITVSYREYTKDLTVAQKIEYLKKKILACVK